MKYVNLFQVCLKNNYYTYLYKSYYYYKCLLLEIQMYDYFGKYRLVFAEQKEINTLIFNEQLG